MIAKETGNGGGSTPVSEGVHVAICYGLVDIGTVHNETFGNDKRQIIITWEIPEERIKLERDGETVDLPRALSQYYTLSLHEKARLRKDLVSWRGREFTAEELAGFDLKNILGKSCQLQIVHKAKADGGVRASIAGIMALPRGLSGPKTTENDIQYFDLDEGTPIPPTVPNWVREKITASPEWKAREAAQGGPAMASNDIPPIGDDDIPF